MPLFRPTPAPPIASPPLSGPTASLSADDFLSPEDIAERRRRRRWLVTLPLLALAAVGLGFGVRPALHAAKAWQSRRTAAEAERLIQQQRWLEARAKVQDAIQLWHLEPAAWRAAALLLGHTGNAREASAFWHKVEAARALTRDEQRDYAQALLAAGDLDAAVRHLGKAWPAGEAGTPADEELAMKLAFRRERRDEAVDLARRLLADRAATARQRLNAALVLITVGNKGSPADGWAEVRRLAVDQASPESLDALLLMAQRAGSAPGADASTEAGQGAFPTRSELIERIEAHPQAGIQPRLLALDLRMAGDPKRRAEWIQSAVDRFAGTKEDADLAILARWLYAHGEFTRVLDVLPPARAADDRALFFLRLDALAALERWAEIRQVIESHPITIDPVVEQMYLARCAQQLGEPKVRDARWEAALHAAGTDPDKLQQLGAYAQKTGNPEIALAAFRAAVQAAPESGPANEALLGRWKPPARHARSAPSSPPWPSIGRGMPPCATTPLTSTRCWGRTCAPLWTRRNSSCAPTRPACRIGRRWRWPNYGRATTSRRSMRSKTSTPRTRQYRRGSARCWRRCSGPRATSRRPGMPCATCRRTGCCRRNAPWCNPSWRRKRTGSVPAIHEPEADSCLVAPPYEYLAIKGAEESPFQSKKY